MKLIGTIWYAEKGENSALSDLRGHVSLLVDTSCESTFLARSGLLKFSKRSGVQGDSAETYDI